MCCSDFFVLSGYLFFSKPFSPQRLKHQVFRILRLYLAWTVIYVPITLENYLDGVSFFKGIFTFVQNLIFSGSYFHLWFLPALVFALMFVSLIRNIKKRYVAVILAVLFIVGLLFESYRFLVPRLSRIFELYEKIFLTTRNGLFFGTIYVYLGYALTQYDIKMKKSYAAVGIVVGLILLCAEGILLFEYKGISVANMTIFALPVSVFTFIFSFRQEVGIGESKLLFIREISTALFCVHPIFISGVSFIDKHVIAIPTVCNFALFMFGTTISALIIVKMSEKYKLMSYLV